MLEGYCARKLMSVFREEIQAAGPFELQYDDAKLSFLTFQASASNVRITEAGETKVLVPRLELNFNLKSLSKRVVVLRDLNFIDAKITGVGPQSVLGRVINYFTTPSSPEVRAQQSFEVELQRLSMRNASGVDMLGALNLGISQFDMLLQLLPSDKYELSSHAQQISFLKPGSMSSLLPILSLRNPTMKVLFDDDATRITAFGANFEGGETSAVFDIADSDLALSGELNTIFNQSSLDSSFFKGNFTSQTKLGGTLLNPKLSSSLTASDLSLLDSLIPGQVDIDSTSLQLESGVKDGYFLASLTKLLSNGENIQIKLSEPLVYESGKLRGALEINVARLERGGQALKNLHSNLRFLEEKAFRLQIESQAEFSSPGFSEQLSSSCSLTLKDITCSINSPDGALNSDFAIKFQENAPALLEMAKIRFERSSQPESRILLEGEFSGPLDVAKLQGSGKVQILRSGMVDSLSGDLSIKDGGLSVHVANQANTLSFSATSNLPRKESGAPNQTQIRARANNFKFESTQVKEESRCSKITFDANIAFPGFEVSDAEGAIELSDVVVGCQPFALNLKQPRNLKVSRGKLNLNDIELVGSSSAVTTNGSISVSEGYAISAAGKTDLSTLLPFTPDIDELSGPLNFDLKLAGKLSAPELQGKADIQQSTLEIESPQLQVRQAAGELLFNGRVVELKNLQGSLNSGKFGLSGILNLDSLPASSLRLNFDSIATSPMEQAELISSGELVLSNLADQQPTISGTVSITNAQLEKKFELLSLVRALSQQLVDSRPAQVSFEPRPETSPFLLNVRVVAPSNMYFDSNFAQAELNADLLVSGPVYTPQIEGQVEILNGWFGLRDRRFDVGSGKIIFTAGKSEPSFEIVAEHSVFSRQGENVVIFATITGTPSQPRIKFDSDRGYTEREIVKLLTGGSEVITTNNRVGMLSQDFGLDVPFVSDDSLFGLGRWLRRLAKIDSLGIEPAYNPTRGVVEPTLIAEKIIWENLILRGESAFAGAGYDARAKLNYELFPRLTVSGIIDAAATQDNTALGVDLSYALRPARAKSLHTDINGNIFLTSESIVTGLKLTEDSRITPSMLPQLSEGLQNYYESQGFPFATFKVGCEEIPEYDRCTRLTINIKEGARLVVKNAVVEGDSLPEPITAWLRSQTNSENTATINFKQEITEGLTARLRNEGFIRARLESHYEEGKNPARIVINAQLGQPVTFIFSGNKVFSQEELLSTINLFKRTQPFGNNTINLLTTNIERLYHQKGYPYAVIAWSILSAKDSPRTVYSIDINEGAKVDLTAVQFEGLQVLTPDQLEDEVEVAAPDTVESIFESSPSLITEQIESNCSVLQATLRYIGFEDARVTYRLSEDLEQNEVTLIYEVYEGPRNILRSIILKDVPPEIQIVLPPQPYSIKKVELVEQSLHEMLESAGYRQPQVTRTTDPQTSSITLEVKPGSLTQIGRIDFEGFEEVKPSVAKERLKIAQGGAWNEELIAESRRSILRTGLFSKVEVRPRDGVIDSLHEDAVVVVEERNLTSIQVGTGINSEHGLHFFGVATDRSYFADGRSVSARSDVYFDQLQGDISQGVMSLNYADPELFAPAIGYVSDLRYQRLEQSSQEFDLDRVSHSGYLHKNFDENVSGSVGHTFLIENLDNVSTGAVLDPTLDTGTIHLSYLQAAMLLDYRDNPLNPRSGYVFALNPQLASRTLGSEAGYGGLDARAGVVIPFSGFFERFGLAYSVRSASAWTFGDTDFIPISQRYYLGGRTSVRGFRENSLGPKSVDGAVIGGDSLVSQSFELRYLLVEDLSLNVFLDSGKLELRDFDAEGEGVRYSTGVGLRYLSPIGPIGFDLGFPLNEKSGEPSSRLHFSIGANF